MAADWGATDAGRVPLFDRLIDEERQISHEPTPYRTLDREGVRSSIRRELERLLATRCPVSGDVALSRPRTILDYGLPDLDWGARNLVMEQKPRLMRLIRETIQAFEPRLTNVYVEILDPATMPVKPVERGGKPISTVGHLFISLSASMLIDNVNEPISFTLAVGAGGGTGNDGR
jgi:type VI secretion system protein ImpF